jgi:hypothetical protein
MSSITPTKWSIDRSSFAHAADSLPDPNDRAVLPQVTLVHDVALDLSLARKLDLSNFGREIIRVGNVLERLGKKLIGWPADNAAQGLVDPEPTAIGSGVCDADRRVLEHGPEPRLALGESAPGLDFLG